MALLDRIGKVGPTPGVQVSPGQDARAYLDCLEQSKAEVQEKISGLFLELGKAYYESHVDDHQTELEEQLAVIRDAYSEIAQYEQQSDEIAARLRCPACGTKLPEGSMFCNICGKKLPDAPGSTEKQKVCPRCNTVLNPDDIFCTSCGMDLRKQ